MHYSEAPGVGLKENGYVVIKEFLNSETVELVKNYLQFTLNRGIWLQTDPSEFIRTPITTHYQGYADPLLEVLLLNSLPAVEEVVGEELLPTYSFKRIYGPGELLLEHNDRAPCEISVTVNVFYKGAPNPIFMRFNNKEAGVILEPGDAVVYFGCETLHRRPRLEDDQMVLQFMLHYVKKNGSNSHLAKDRRADYGYPHCGDL